MEPASGSPQSDWQSTPPAPEAPAGWRYAGFWIRLAAYLIDSLVLGAIFAAGMILSPPGAVGPLFALAVVVYLLYLPVLWWRGQTVGMRLLGLHLVRADGSGRLSLGRAFLRYLGFLLSAALFYIGLIWVAFDARKQGWHDKMADSVVLHRAG